MLCSLKSLPYRLACWPAFCRHVSPPALILSRRCVLNNARVAPFITVDELLRCWDGKLLAGEHRAACFGHRAIGNARAQMWTAKSVADSNGNAVGFFLTSHAQDHFRRFPKIHHELMFA